MNAMKHRVKRLKMKWFIAECCSKSDSMLMSKKSRPLLCAEVFVWIFATVKKCKSHCTHGSTAAFFPSSRLEFWVKGNQCVCQGLHSTLPGSLLPVICMQVKCMYSHIPSCITVKIRSWHVRLMLSNTDLRKRQLTCENHLTQDNLGYGKCTFLKRSLSMQHIDLIILGQYTAQGIPTCF